MRGLTAMAVSVVLVLAGVLGVASASAGPSVRHCQTADLSVSSGHGSAALSHYRQTVKLKNTSNSTCTMSGWFTVKLLNAHGKVLSSHEKRITQDYFGKSPKTTVTVKPNGRASFAIDTVAPAKSCPRSNSVAVTPPGGHGSKQVKLGVLACASFGVLPVQPDNKAIHG